MPPLSPPSRQAAQDWIDWVPGCKMWGGGHGTLPAAPGFGARVFGSKGVIDHDHDHYRDRDRDHAPGTQSLGNIGSIVLGREAAVTLPSSPVPPVQASG